MVIDEANSTIKARNTKTHIMIEKKGMHANEISLHFALHTILTFVEKRAL